MNFPQTSARWRECFKDRKTKFREIKDKRMNLSFFVPIRAGTGTGSFSPDIQHRMAFSLFGALWLQVHYSFRLHFCHVNIFHSPSGDQMPGEAWNIQQSALLLGHVSLKSLKGWLQGSLIQHSSSWRDLFSSAFQVGFPLQRRMLGPVEMTASIYLACVRVLLLGADAVQRAKTGMGWTAFTGVGLEEHGSRLPETFKQSSD